jgi:hypothetical protein
VKVLGHKIHKIEFPVYPSYPISELDAEYFFVSKKNKNVNLMSNSPPIVYVDIFFWTQFALMFVWPLNSRTLFTSHHYLYAMQDTHKNKNNKTVQLLSYNTRTRCVRERGELSCLVGVILIKVLYITTSCAYVAWGWLWMWLDCGTHNNLIYFALSWSHDDDGFLTSQTWKGWKLW